MVDKVKPATNSRKLRWASTRIRGSTKPRLAACSPSKKTHLLPPLPLEPFGYYHCGERIVRLDGCMRFSEENPQVAMKRERQLLFFIHLLFASTSALGESDFRGANSHYARLASVAVGLF